MSSGFSTYVDSPYISILAGRASVAIETSFAGKNYALYKFPTRIYTHSIRISPKTYVVRGIDTSVKKTDQIFVKANSETNQVTREKNVSETNGDAGLSTDGMLSYDPINHLIIYPYFYENKFLCMDTNLNLVYTGRTIDNTKSLPIKSTVNKNVLTTTTPKRIVNNYSLISQGYLFINSGIKANNEDNKAYQDNSIVDIYETKTGAYKGTFYIPEFNGEKMRTFNIIDEGLIAIYKSKVVKYKFSIRI
ncbi:MAG TPA: hypothetical protein VIK74_06000 [Parasegetibacter sp.]